MTITAGTRLGNYEILAPLGRGGMDALREAHSRGIIHRDIKSQNIMMTPRGQAKGLLDELKEMSGSRYVPGYVMATLPADLGDKERAIEWLEKSYEESSALLAFLKVDPGLASLRADPRFTDLLRRVGFSS